MQKLRAYIPTVVAALVVAAVLAALFWMRGVRNGPDSVVALRRDAGVVAVVHRSDGSEERLPLDTDARIEIESSLGRNVVVVENGAARMEEADCPKRTCVDQAPISSPGQQIVCLPHRVWVEIEARGTGAADDADPDAQDKGAVDLVAR